MLRASAQASGIPIELRSVSDTTIDPNVPAGTEILNFVDALIGNDSGAVEATRQELVDKVGPDGAARAAMVTGNFEMMNRILDAAGVPVPVRMGAISPELGLAPFTGLPHA